MSKTKIVERELEDVMVSDDKKAFQRNIPILFALHILLRIHFFCSVLIPFFQDWGGLSFSEIMILESIFTGAIFLFEIPTGTIADKFGRKTTLFIFLTLIMISSLSLMFIPKVDTFLIIPLIGMLYFSWSGETAATWALVMDIINPKIGASEHQIICSIVNFGDTVISAAAGAMVVFMGFQNVFLLSAIIVIPAIITLYHVKGEKIK